MRDDWSILTWLDLTWLDLKVFLRIGQFHQCTNTMRRKHEPVTPAPVTDHFTRGCATKHSPLSSWLVRLYKFFLAPVYHTHLPNFTLFSYQWFACVKLCKSFLGAPIYHTHSPKLTLSLTSGLLVLNFVRVFSGPCLPHPHPQVHPLTSGLPVLNFVRAFLGPHLPHTRPPFHPPLLPAVCLC